MTEPAERRQELTWTCHVCGDERPDELIGVARFDWRRGDVRMRTSVRHCLDRPGCEAGTLTVAVGWAPGWEPA